MFEKIFDDMAEKLRKESIDTRNKIDKNKDIKEEHEIEKLNDIDLSLNELNETIKVNLIRDIKNNENKNEKENEKQNEKQNEYKRSKNEKENDQGLIIEDIPKEDNKNKNKNKEKQKRNNHNEYKK
jgi:hypothetical protein